MSRPGRLTPAELESVGGGMRLLKPAARAWKAASADLAAAFGFAPIITAGVGAYRTIEQQAALYGSDPDAVRPEYSDHCRGIAVDVFNQRELRNRDQDRFLAIMRRHGFTFNVRSEPWHCIHDRKTVPAADEATPIQEETNMLIVHHIVGRDQAKYLFTGLTLTLAPSPVKDSLPTVRAEGRDALQPYLEIIDQATAAIADKVVARLPATAGGVSAEQVADEIAERLRE